MNRTLSFFIEVFFLVEYLTSLTIESGIRLLVDISFCSKLIPDRLCRRPVTNLVGRSNKIIGGGMECCMKRIEELHMLIKHGFGVLPELLCSVVDLRSMFIGSGQEESIVSRRAIVAGEDIGDDELHSMSHMRSSVHVWDRCGDESVLHRKMITGKVDYIEFSKKSIKKDKNIKLHTKFR